MTTREIARALGISSRAALQKANKGGWPFETVNGRGDRDYLLEKLPEDVRLKISSVNLPALARPAPAPALVSVGSPDLPDWANRRALAWADLIRQFLDARKSAANGSKLEAARLFLAGYNTGRLLPQIFAALGPKSYGAVMGHVAKYREAGFDYLALAPGWGNRKGDSKITEAEFNAALSFALHPNRLAISQVTRLVKMKLAKAGIPSPSSEATLRRALEKWRDRHYDRWVFLRKGEKALNDEVLPYIERESGLLDVGDVLVADGHTLNFQVLHPFTGKPCRPTLILWYDWASRYPAGFCLMPTEDVQVISAALRRAILALGKPPRWVYLDNGKAFKAKFFSSAVDFEQAGFEGLYGRLGVRVTYAMPYNAQSKVVERFFGAFAEIERLMPTFAGASIQDKPAHMLRNERLHQAVHEKRYGGWVPDIEQASSIVRGWFGEYAQRPHRGLRGLRPIDLWQTGLGPGVDPEALRHMMMAVAVATVHRNGVTVKGRHYWAEELYGWREPVLVKYDLEDLSSVLVYSEDGSRFVCQADPVQGVHPMAAMTGRPDDLAAVKEGNRRKAHLKKATTAEARAYLLAAPDLVEVPSLGTNASVGATRASPARPAPAPRLLTRAEAEKIEADAARMKVVEFKPRPKLYQNEIEKYEDLLEAEFKGAELPMDDLTWLRWFETTVDCRLFKNRFDFLKEFWSTEAGEAEGTKES